MINFLHTNIPGSIFISFGPFTIYYYGLLIVTGIILGLLVSSYLAKIYNVSVDLLLDSAFVVIIAGLVGGRIYHVLLELPYYLEYPLNIFKVWQGGLAIHGGIIFGAITIWWFARKNNFSFWKLTSLYVPALALAQTIGRWGNYFNQELYGLPTDKAWGIPIKLINRVAPYQGSEYFHPTFLYESIGNFLIFLILLGVHYLFIRKKYQNFFIITLLYLVLYSILRFSLEFIRIDKTPEFIGLRVPQITSLIIIVVCVIIAVVITKGYKNTKEIKENNIL